jgi:hypothetical protein
MSSNGFRPDAWLGHLLQRSAQKPNFSGECIQIGGGDGSEVGTLAFGLNWIQADLEVQFLKDRPGAFG